MFNWLGLSAVNPFLLWGTLAVAAPILIHLLSKRKFRIIDWAAIDFLLEADKRNRRRIRLENLILLLLRCLAVILLALLVARIILKPTGIAARVTSPAPYEQIVLLDDSPSMTAHIEGRDAFEAAKEGLADFVAKLGAERPNDTLTLILTSKPNEPVQGINGVRLSPDKALELGDTIKKLQASDLSANLGVSLHAVERAVREKGGNLNKVVYIVSDMRARDWMQAKETPQPQAVAHAIKALTEDQRVQAVYIADVGGAPQGNLSIAEVEPLDKSIVAGVETRFEVTVENHGETDQEDVQVTLEAGDSPPVVGKVTTLRAGSKERVPFTVTFHDQGMVPVTVRLPGGDVLSADNVRFYAARVREGVETLVVDGDAMALRGKGESFFLERALAPGNGLSGNTVKVVNESQFATMSLDGYQAIYILNSYNLAPVYADDLGAASRPAADVLGGTATAPAGAGAETAERVTALENYVKNGGGLVVFLGEQVNAETYNDQLYKNGQGLLPFRLGEMHGDDTRQKWVEIVPEMPDHPVVSLFAGPNNPFSKMVKYYRWWGTTVPPELKKTGKVNIVATLTDTDSSPLIAEKSFGAGRVLAVTVPPDDAWSNWPSDPSGSFLVTLQEINRHVARRTTGDGELGVGVPINFDVDTNKYTNQAEVVVRPDGGTAAEPDPITASIDDTAHRTVLTYGGAHEPEKTARKGFYSLRLKRHTGDVDAVLYALNIDPSEGDLRPADTGELAKRLDDPKVSIVRGKTILSRGTLGGSSEFWKYTLVFIVLLLCAEQYLAWTFGRRR